MRQFVLVADQRLWLGLPQLAWNVYPLPRGGGRPLSSRSSARQPWSTTRRGAGSKPAHWRASARRS